MRVCKLFVFIRIKKTNERSTTLVSETATTRKQCWEIDGGTTEADSWTLDSRGHRENVDSTRLGEVWSRWNGRCTAGRRISTPWAVGWFRRSNGAPTGQQRLRTETPWMISQSASSLVEGSIRSAEAIFPSDVAVTSTLSEAAWYRPRNTNCSVG